MASTNLPPSLVGSKTLRTLIVPVSRVFVNVHTVITPDLIEAPEYFDVPSKLPPALVVVPSSTQDAPVRDQFCTTLFSVTSVSPMSSENWAGVPSFTLTLHGVDDGQLF